MAKLNPWMPILIGSLTVATMTLAPLSGSQGVAIAAPTVAPDFSLPLSGSTKKLKLSDYAGKVRIVNFWATWCPPCRAEIPEFVKLSKELKPKGVVFIGISLDRDGDASVAPFVKQQAIPYPIVLGNEDVANAYGGIRGIPTTFVVDRKGKIVQKWIGLPGGSPEEVRANLLKTVKPLL